MTIKYTNKDNEVIISEMEVNDQIALLNLISYSLKKPRLVQYKFTEILNEFTKLTPDSKKQEAKVWIQLMEEILSEESKKDKNRCGDRVCGG